ncbi:cytochrome P450, partial [Myxococcota bacterium]|nr:cytochrome P450 [Myxococcota bacterium]
NLISNGALQLDRHPDEHRRLVADPGLVPTAVEEFLRFDPPVQGFERFMSEDVELGGQMIREGDTVFLLLASANRDEQHIHDPDRFDVGRTPNRHLSFGWGTHFCLGASLARLEAKVAWEEILRRLPQFQITGPVERLHSDIIRGLLAVPLEFEAIA